MKIRDVEKRKIARIVEHEIAAYSFLKETERSQFMRMQPAITELFKLVITGSPSINRDQFDALQSVASKQLNRASDLLAEPGMSKAVRDAAKGWRSDCEYVCNMRYCKEMREYK